MFLDLPFLSFLKLMYYLQWIYSVSRPSPLSPFCLFFLTMSCYLGLNDYKLVTDLPQALQHWDCRRIPSHAAFPFPSVLLLEFMEHMRFLQTHFFPHLHRIVTCFLAVWMRTAMVLSSLWLPHYREANSFYLNAEVLRHTQLLSIYTRILLT